MSINNVSIIGMGALGIMYGKCIADSLGNEAVSFVVDEARFDRYQGRKVTCNGEVCDFRICKASDMKPVDLVIVAVKSTGLDSALETMRNCVGENTIIISVMNGITSEEMIGSRYGMEKIIYTVAQGMDAMRFGDELRFTRSGELHIGKDNATSQLETLTEFFDRANMAYVVEEDIIYRMWSKFMLNVGVNQTCMVYDTTYSGVLEDGEPNLIFVSAMREVVSIANAEGVSLGEKDINNYIDIIKTLDPKGTPSMGQDRINHNKSEVEAFAGTVIRIADKHGIKVPVNRYLYKRVAEIESEY